MIFDIVVDIVLLKRENIVFLLVERRKERSKKLSPILLMTLCAVNPGASNSSN
jgi:hypothetical protein